MAGGSTVTRYVLQRPMTVQPDLGIVHQKSSSTGPISRAVRHPPAYLRVIIMTNRMYRPAGGHFTVEMAGNKGLTTLSHDGKFAKAFGDGRDHPEGLGTDGHWSVA